jgi:uncharacterized protein (DUF885 family)
MVRTELLAKCLRLMAGASICIGFIGGGSYQAQTDDKPKLAEAWISKSNLASEELIKAQAMFNPEDLSDEGRSEYDRETVDLNDGLESRKIIEFQKVYAKLKHKLSEEADPKVREDLELLMDATDQEIEKARLEEKYKLPYLDVAAFVYGNSMDLLNDQIDPKRQVAASYRLRLYAGLELGSKPLTELVIKRVRAKMATPGILFPTVEQLKRDLGTSKELLKQLGELFDQHKSGEYKEAYVAFKQQAEEYYAFAEKEILPKARTDFRLPNDLYVFKLRRHGVDENPEMLARSSRQDFERMKVQAEAEAAKIADAKGWKFNGYIGVINSLRNEQLPKDEILPFYKKTYDLIAAIIKNHKIVTLPDFPPRMRLANAAETLTTNSPYFLPAARLNNQGEKGEFILPLNAFLANGLTSIKDFTNPSAAWAITAHELRPGHELQASILNAKSNGKASYARNLLAYDVAEIEGWGVYSEWLIEPYMPSEGKLICLQFRMQRAARAFLEPWLHEGKVTITEAKKVLTQEVGLSEVLADQEIQRYTFRRVGEAPAYYYGFTELLKLRQDTEAALGKRFNQKAYHDFVLQQGLLPIRLIRKAVFAEFIEVQKKQLNTAKKGV